MKIRSIALALTLAALPLPLLAQTTPAAPQQQREQRAVRQGRLMQRSAADALLRNRERLALTSAQVSRLEAIRQRLESQNRPLLERIRTAREGAVPGGLRGRRGQLTEQQREALRHTREQLRPVAQQLRENRRTARQEAQSVLTEAQRQQLRQWRQQRAGERRGAQGREGRRGRRGGRRGF